MIQQAKLLFILIVKKDFGQYNQCKMYKISLLE